MASVRTSTVDDFIAKRRKESGKKRGSLVSPATVNKDLRHLKAAMRKARRWGYVAAVPDFDMEKEPGKLPRYVTPEHFAALYEACRHAKMPADVPNVDTANWWRGLLVFIYMTGWRIGAVLALRREDLSLDEGFALSRHDDNKGKRDAQVPLHPVAVEHLRRLRHFDVCIFPWNYDRTTLQNEFRRLQQAANINLPCRGSHKHTDACHAYGFHDLRRAFATMNADRMTGDALQHLMQHRSYATTQRYINMTRQLNEAVAALHVPDVLKKAASEG